MAPEEDSSTLGRIWPTSFTSPSPLVMFSPSASGGKLEVPISSGHGVSAMRNMSCNYAVSCARVAHALLPRHHRRRETTKRILETEAEAVACVVCEAVGLKAWLTFRVVA